MGKWQLGEVLPALYTNICSIVKPEVDSTGRRFLEAHWTGHRGPRPALSTTNEAVAYDEALAERVRAVIGDDPRLSERKMFGGLCLMVNGNMCVGIVGDELMVRVGRDAYADALTHPDAREMDFTGRPMRTMVFVRPVGVATNDQLEYWVDRGLELVASLPPKR